MKDGTPETEAEARALRAYVPAELLAEVSRLSKEESAECDRRFSERNKACDAIKAIKANMVRERREIKALEAKKAKLDAQRIYVRTDAARVAAWQAASQLRAESLARGEPLRTETSADTTARIRLPA